MNRRRCFLLFCVLAFLSSCESLIDEIIIYDNKNQEIIFNQDSVFIASMQKRAQQLTNICWIPRAPMPNDSPRFLPGRLIKGIPYSSVKELDKFVGIDVSFHTFMTAVNNPRSIIYTDNVSIAPYKGINCSTYYGTVCNAAVCFALGANFPWSTYMVDSTPYFSKNSDTSPYSIEVGDLLWKKGHDALVYDIERDELTDSIRYVTIFEAIGTGPRIVRYNVDDYLVRWENDNLVDYKYTSRSSSREYKPIPFCAVGDEIPVPFEYNDDLCPQLGDKAVYREDDPVVVNLFNDRFHVLEIMKNARLLEPIMIQDKDIKLPALSFGRYSVVAKDTIDCVCSKSVSFDVVDTNVSVERDGSILTVYFESKYASPVFVTICEENGLKHTVVELNEEERKNGYTSIGIPNLYGDLFCKVYFETDWGRVTNIPIRL